MENLTVKKEAARRRIKDGMVRSVAVYVIVILFLAVVNRLSAPGTWWVVWPALGWGTGLAIGIVSKLNALRSMDDGDE